MKVSTDEFEIEPHAYARVLAIAYFKRNAWVYALCALVTIYGLAVGGLHLIAYGLGAAAALALYRLWGFHRFARDPENDSFFDPRRHTFTENILEATTADGTEVRQPIASLVRAERHDDHWKLFVSKGYFHYLPFSAFGSDADVEALDRVLREQVAPYKT